MRNLSLREQELHEQVKRLPVGDKRMFNRAKKILASELMYARDLDEKEADNFLTACLKRWTLSPSADNWTMRLKALGKGLDFTAPTTCPV